MRMTANAWLARYDALDASMDTEARAQWLLHACGEYDAEAPEDVRGRAALWNELGGLCRGGGILDRSEAAFLRAKRLLEDAAPGADYATVLNNLAGLYRLQRRRAEARSMFEKAGEVYARCEGIPADVLASCSNNLGLLELDEQHWTQALERFQQALRILGDMDNPRARGTTLANMAFAELGSGNRAAAAERMNTAAELYETVDSTMAAQCRRYAQELEGTP